MVKNTYRTITIQIKQLLTAFPQNTDSNLQTGLLIDDKSRRGSRKRKKLYLFEFPTHFTPNLIPSTNLSLPEWLPRSLHALLTEQTEKRSPPHLAPHWVMII